MKEKFTNTKYRWIYYPKNKAGYLRLKDGEVYNTLPLVEGHLYLDKDKKGNILGVEFIG